MHVPLAQRLAPEDAFRLLARRFPHVVWSDPAAGPAFVGAAEDGDALVVEEPEGPDPVGALLGRLRADGRAERSDEPGLGWWGWLGYELGVAGLGLPPAASPEPAAAFLLARAGVLVDRDAGTAVLVALPGAEALAARVADALAAPPPDAAPAPAVLGWSWRHGRQAHLEAIAACRAAIAAGEAYQLCLTDRAAVELAAPPDPAAVYLALRRRAAAPHGGVVRVGGHVLVSVSPETFLEADGSGTVSSSPIKGTRRRDPDPVRDAGLAAALAADGKERAENVMIVDLVRNDLARTARVGSVEVTRLCAVETYPAVHQLVSTVTAEVPGDGLAALPALFPAGSMTGAPKHRAVQLLAGLEQGPRGAYAGAWGRIGADGAVLLQVVIRSVVLTGSTATVGTGGGITILSDPEAEWREVELKARPLLAALGVRL